MREQHRFRFPEAAGLASLAILLAVYAPYSGHASQASSDGSWELGISVLDADLSPDDQFVAVTRESPQNAKHGDSVDEWVELWDFRKDQQVAKARIGTYTVGWSARTAPVRFTSDGKFVVAACATAIVVLDAGTLNLVRTIELAGIRRLEISPASHTAVVASAGDLLVVDLDSGHVLFAQITTDTTGFPYPATSISWKPDGTQFAVAVGTPCTRSGAVRVFGGNPWAQVQTLHSKNVAAVSFSVDRVYAVQTSLCKGSVFNKHLGMQVFNGKTWKRERTILLHDKDLHDSVSYADGRLLADSAFVETSFDALDFSTYPILKSVQVTLWDGNANSIIYTSSTLPVPAARTPEGRLRLSRTGKMALIVDGRVRLIQLP